MKRIMLNEYLVADPEICHGKPTFKGTRIMVWQVLEMLAAGERIETILEDFPSLTARHIRAALDYAAQVTGGERLLTFPAHELAHR
jgi:uncharacterized protein (DUF433 family)